MLKKLLCFLLISFTGFNIFSQTRLSPTFNLSAYGGKYYIDDTPSSIDLNINAIAMGTIIIDENNSIYSLYNGYYSGIEDLTELIGGDLLIKKKMSHTISLKYVFSKDFNYIKPRISYTINYLKESKDESFGNGLFDYNSYSAGIELEQERPDATYKESFDFFNVSYPNYASLVFKSQTIIDTTTYKELSINAGKDVLNSRNYRSGFSYTIFPQDIILTPSLYFTYKDYYDQSIIDETGGFRSNKRRDLLSEFSINLERANKNNSLNILFNISYLKSNQNSYDASRTKYIDDYYSYFSFDITPNFNLNFKNERGSFSYSFTYTRLNYIKRPAQDESGNYLNSKIYQNFYTSVITLKYKILKDLYTKAIYSYQDVNSNMKYEAGYRYNYSSHNFMLGIEVSF